MAGEPAVADVPSKSNDEEDCKEVDPVYSETAEVQSMEEKIACPYDDNSSCMEEQGEHVKSVDDDNPSSVSPSCEEERMVVKLAVLSEVKDENTSDELNRQVTSGPDILPQDTSGENDKHQISGEPTNTSFGQGQCG